MAYSVCGTCRGEGKIVNRGASVWTESDRAADPDGFQSMLDGAYDVPCDECGGLRVTTSATRSEFRDRRSDHFTMLAEQGIGPGSPDWY